MECKEIPVINFYDGNKPDITWSNTCDASIEKTCRVSSPRQCTLDGAKKSIGGRDVTLPCWEYSTTYQCGESDIDTCGNTDKCSVLSSKCLDTKGAFCTLSELILSCETKKECKSSEMVCGTGDHFCADGNCVTLTNNQTDTADFVHKASQVAGVVDAVANVEDKGAPDIRFEKGRDQRCKHGVAGLYDCCKIRSSAIHRCEIGEEELFHAKKEKRVVNLGKYCCRRVLGICLEQCDGNCIFDTKLARIIQEQGRAQLRKPFGQAKNPDCSGFSMEEFEKIDFNLMDWSEYTQDLIDGLDIPNKEDIIDQTKERMKRS
jgi:conjugal transfer mating pair stabilization protein TraN